jgi:hypothetical protein
MVVTMPARRASLLDQTALGAVLDRNEERQPPGERLGKSATAEQTFVVHFNQIELADRWRVSPRTLERWRWLKTGPRYIKIGGRVIYCLDDVKAYEAQQARG